MKHLCWLLAATLLVSSCKKNDDISPNYSKQGVGASAHDILSSDKFQSIVVEIQYMPGYAAEANSLSNMISFLNGVCNKPGGITSTVTQVNSAGDDTLSLAEVRGAETARRTMFTHDNTLVIYILISDGYYSENDVLGIAHLNTSVCLFGKTIDKYSGNFGQVSKLVMESTVLEHEMGHLLGLVDLYTPMVTPHEDPAHEKHCNNQNCLMYYAAESSGLVTMGGNIPALDANCKNDLKANGGK